jgi:hypothetical protein
MRKSDAILVSLIVEFGECVFSHTKRASKGYIRKDAIYYFYDAYWLCKADGSFIGPQDQLEPLLKCEIFRIDRRSLKIQSILRAGDLYHHLSTSMSTEHIFTINSEIWQVKEGDVSPYKWGQE